MAISSSSSSSSTAAAIPPSSLLFDDDADFFDRLGSDLDITPSSAPLSAENNIGPETPVSEIRGRQTAELKEEVAFFDKLSLEENSPLPAAAASAASAVVTPPMSPSDSDFFSDYAMEQIPLSDQGFSLPDRGFPSDKGFPSTDPGFPSDKGPLSADQGFLSVPGFSSDKVFPSDQGFLSLPDSSSPLYSAVSNIVGQEQCRSDDIGVKQEKDNSVKQNLSEHSLDPPHSVAESQPSYRQLQWSCFTETISDETMDFFSDLGYNKDSVDYTVGSKPNYGIAASAEHNSLSLNRSSNGPSNGLLNISSSGSSVGVMGTVEEFHWEMAQPTQKMEMQSIQSSAENSTAEYYWQGERKEEDQHQGYVANSWESQYPGWYFDHSVQEWKQIDGYNNPSQQEEQGQVAALADHGNAIATDPQYPGWYYNHQALEWQQSGGNPPSNEPSSAQESHQFPTQTDSSNGHGHFEHFQDNSVPQHVSTSLPWGDHHHDTQTEQNRNIARSFSFNHTVKAPTTQAFQTIDTRGEATANTGVGIAMDAFPSSDQGRNEPVKHSRSQSLSSVSFATPTTTQWGGAGGGYGYGQTVAPAFNPAQQYATMANQSFQDGSVSQPAHFKSHAWGNEYPENLSSGLVSNYTPALTQASYNGEQPATLYASQFHHGSSISVAPRTNAEALRSTAGRPPHALFTFGFGGRVALLNSSSQFNSSWQSNTHEGFVGSSPLTLRSLSQLVAEKAGGVSENALACYLKSLERSGISGPLPGNAGAKELHKWIDAKAASCAVEEPQSDPEALRMLWGVLKIAYQHYGKLRLMAGSSANTSATEDGPEVALGKLLASSAKEQFPLPEFPLSGGLLQCVPLEQQLQEAALEMKNLLISGKRKQALEYAQQGGLWGFAILLAWQLGEKYFAETVASMARQQFVPGCPLRTFCMLLVGQTAEVFTRPAPLVEGAIDNSQMQDGASYMLRNWHENLAMMAANRTKGDEQAIMHLGDCIWKSLGEVAGAHTCYLVAEANFEVFSGSARLCLAGADHYKNPRTFASVEAIQRTELYEHCKVMGNSQFTLLPFQPFKYVYANMLAEAGKVTEALRYCQAVGKTLKSAGHALEVDFCRQSAIALEERLRIQSQSGYNFNISPGKLMVSFLKSFDSTISKIIGGPPSSAVPEPQTSNGHDLGKSPQVTGAPFSRSNTSPMVESASSSNFLNGKKQVQVPARSISEPDFSKASNQEIATRGNSSAKDKNNGNCEPVKNGYLGRFGSRFLATAAGIIKQNRKEAKLGDSNKFYYDEKLKRWVEEGVEMTAEELAPPPPPVATGFDTPNSKNASGMGNLVPTGTPPLPPSGNQFSARGRLQGVRSRYVDTFNKGGSSSTSSKTPQSFIPSSSGINAAQRPSSFFVPAAPSTETNGLGIGTDAENSVTPNPPLTHDPVIPKNLSSSFMAAPLVMHHRHSSADDVMQAVSSETRSVLNDSVPTFSEGSVERALSWSGMPNYMNGSAYAPPPTGTSYANPNLNSFMPISNTSELRQEPHENATPSPLPPLPFMGSSQTPKETVKRACPVSRGSGQIPNDSFPSSVNFAMSGNMYSDMEEIGL